MARMGRQYLKARDLRISYTRLGGPINGESIFESVLKCLSHFFFSTDFVGAARQVFDFQLNDHKLSTSAFQFAVHDINAMQRQQVVQVWLMYHLVCVVVSTSYMHITSRDLRSFFT